MTREDINKGLREGWLVSQHDWLSARNEQSRTRLAVIGVKYVFTKKPHVRIMLVDGPGIPVV